MSDRLLVLVRHGQSEWNLKNLFTGWKDPDLTEQGVAEAKEAGRKLKAQGLTFDIAFTSVLTRAQHTLDLMLAELGQTGLPARKDQALNERDYGDLSGLNKDDARKKWGEEQVLIWRRSYDVPPPGGESLKDTLARTLPYYVQEILPCVLRGERTLVAAHGNSLRALIMVLEKLNPQSILKRELATGAPVIYRLNADSTVASKLDLGGVSAGAEIVALGAPVADAALEQLAEVLADCVEGGASVSFMAPFPHASALAFFRKVAASVAVGDTVLLAAKLDGKIVGTVQLGLDTPPNQPHRADIRKMLVHRSARGHGIGAALMAKVEEEARRQGRWLLVLDTVPGESGHRLYRRAGWIETGLVPDYAMFPDGRLCDTAIMWKRLDKL